MRAFLELVALVSLDDDQERKLLDIDTSVDDSDDATTATWQSTQITLAASASAQAVPFGGVTHASIVLIIANDAVSVQLNSNTAPLIPIRPTPAVTTTAPLSNVQKYAQPGLFMLRGRLDSLFLTNPSSSATASVFVALVGEAS